MNAAPPDRDDEGIHWLLDALASRYQIYQSMDRRRDTMIAPCTCKSEQQDRLHGKEKRVFNPTKEKGLYRCTVCLKEKSIGHRE